MAACSAEAYKGNDTCVVPPRSSAEEAQQSEAAGLLCVLELRGYPFVKRFPAWALRTGPNDATFLSTHIRTHIFDALHIQQLSESED